MRSLFCVATTLLAAASVYAQSFTINTPSNAVVCQPLSIQWQGGTSPYYLVVLSGNDPTGSALENLGTVNGTSFVWKVNIAAGTSIDLTLRDSAGNIAQTAAFTINSGTDTSCVGQTVSGSAGTGSATATPTTGGTTGKSTVTGTSTAGTGTPTSNAGTSPSTTNTGTSPSSTKSGSAASPDKVAKIGTAGIFGAALAALLI